MERGLDKALMSTETSSTEKNRGTEGNTEGNTEGSAEGDRVGSRVHWAPAGQAKLEYILALALIVVAAVVIYLLFGNALKEQSSTATMALSGQSSKSPKSASVSSGIHMDGGAKADETLVVYDDGFLSGSGKPWIDSAAAAPNGKGMAKDMAKSKDKGKEMGQDMAKDMPKGMDQGTGKGKSVGTGMAKGMEKGQDKGPNKGQGKEGIGSGETELNSWLMQALIAKAAKARLGEGGWGNPGYRGGLGWLTEHKCNLFIKRVAEEGNSMPPLLHNRPATAEEMANPQQHIEGWKVVLDGSLQEGDVVAIAMPDFECTGHMGVVVFHNKEPTTVSLSSNTGDIEWNDWGFRDYGKMRKIESHPDFVGPPQLPFADRDKTIRRYISP
ncbi:MAG: hypothetical protein FWG75_06890 [Cystobacterineae bacterium]|nr:hypothetical protein [Cystobacterineae bacterium]